MATRVKTAFEDPSSLPVVCVHILAYLQALQRHHHSAHWQAKGVAGYQDHLLFERLYGVLADEIDGLAEKIVATFGADKVNASALTAEAAQLLAQWEAMPDPLTRALQAEQSLQQLLAVAVKLTGISLGMDDLLRGIADTHDTAVYLLQQRLS